MMKRYVLIVAGGRGLRMGSDLPKQFIPMEGKPVLMHTLEAFHRWDASAGLILVLPEDHQPYWKMLCREIGCKVPHRIANGGETRFQSVPDGMKTEICLEGMKRRGSPFMMGSVLLSLPKLSTGVLPRLKCRVLLSRLCLWLILSASFPAGRAVRSIVRVIRRCKPRRFSIMICF